MALHAAADPSPVACAICESPAPLYGVVDFHKSCLEEKGLKVALSGIPVYYRRCRECGFLFADGFDSWTPEEFTRLIYNEDYVRVDPKYLEVRPSQCAKLIDDMFHAQKSALRLMDYGGGNGRMAELLCQQGYQAVAYDPFSKHHLRPAIKADIVTAFEVMEHTNHPKETLDDILSFLAPGGTIVFSTMVQPDDFDRNGLNWWYVAPRNGHISIHSPASLKRLFEERDMAIVSVNGHIHFACRLLDKQRGAVHIAGG